MEHAERDPVSDPETPTGGTPSTDAAGTDSPAGDAADAHTQTPGSQEEGHAQAPENETEYIPISKHCLRMDTITGFDVYLQEPEGSKYTLLAAGDVSLSESHAQQLRESKTPNVYIAATDRKALAHYLEDNLDKIVADETLPVRNKMRIAYACGIQMIHSVLADPSDKNIKRVHKFVSSSVELFTRDASALHNMLGSISFDYHVHTHSTNVYLLSIALGHRIGLSMPELNDLGVGLLLHDLGKMKINPEILNKHGRLTDEEWAIVKGHPATGAEILEQTQQLTPASLAVVRQHHEKVTGKGYPLGLQGPQIHLYAKIAALADVLDALTTKRCYKDAVNTFPAIQIMHEEMSADFNLPLFNELIRMLGGARHEPGTAEEPADAAGISRPAA